MGCLDLEALESYATAQLDEPTRQAVSEHLAACLECSSQLDEITQDLKVLARLRESDRTSGAGTEAWPSEVGAYRLLRELGRGGSGVVFEAEQREPRRRVAVKLLGSPGGGPETEGILRREASALARLRHPSIAAIYEAGRMPDGGAYFAMELVEGESLVAFAQERQLSVRDRLALFSNVCDAVAYAHQRGVIHRDLKPSNVLVEHDGTPKVLDFGLARILAQESESEALPRSEIGRVFGTLPYMSPEHVRGDSHEIDVRSDVYSLGVILFELLSGRLPYAVHSGDLLRSARIICEEPAAPLRRLCPEVPLDVETITLKALAKEPDRRYAGAAEFAADIRRHLEDRPVLARAPTVTYQLSRFARRNRALVAAVGGVFLTLVVGTVVSAWQAALAHAAKRDAREALALAERNEQRAMAEADKSRAVNEILQTMLEAPNPEHATGRDVTVAEILGRMLRELDAGSLAGRPAIEVSVRATIGNTYRALGDFESAGVQLRHAVDMARGLGPAGREDLAFSLNKLARVELETSHYAAAEQLFLEALDTYRGLHGPEHADVAKMLNNLGTAMHFAGRYDQAGWRLREGLDMRRRLLGTVHVDIASSLNNLALNLQATGRYRDAEAAYRESLDMDRRPRGAAHPNVAVTMANLGILLADHGNPAEAESLLREALSVQRGLYDETHPAVTLGLRNLGHALMVRGKLAEAERLQRESLELDRRAGRYRQPGTAEALANLGWVLVRQGRMEDAIAAHAEALAVLQDVLPPDHPKTIATRFGLGATLLQAKRLEEAERQVGESIASARRINDPELTGYLRFYARHLISTGKFEAAETALLESQELIRSRLGAEHPDARSVAAALAELHKTWTRPAVADPVKRRSVPESP